MTLKNFSVLLWCWHLKLWSKKSVDSVANAGKHFFLHFTLLRNGRSVHFMRVVFTHFMTVLKSLLVRFPFSFSNKSRYVDKCQKFISESYFVKVDILWEGHKALTKSLNWFEKFLVTLELTGRFCHIFVAFSEYANFDKLWQPPFITQWVQFYYWKMVLSVRKCIVFAFLFMKFVLQSFSW